MLPVIDLTKSYGIVLEGGGAKGAYQIGAWKALAESGVKIRGVAGTSVGALNGALMCMGDLEKAEEIWENISYSQIMDVSDKKMQELFSGELPITEMMNRFFQTIGSGGMDVTPLKELISGYIDEERILSSPVELYVHTFSVDDKKDLDLDMKQIDRNLIRDYLLASALIFPLFKNEKLHGRTYIDGGAINNVPLDSLVSRGYPDIIMIRIFGIGREKKVDIPEGTVVYSIEPRVNLGNIIDFNPQKSRRNMTIGYFDTMRFIYGLTGKIYYLDEHAGERECLHALTSPDERQMEELKRNYHLPEDTSLLLRQLVDSALPAAAAELKLPKTWNYRELYLAVLEATARLCKVPKYRIYTPQELMGAIIERRSQLYELKRIPSFVSLIV